MKIIKSTEPIDVQHPVFAWFGQPGIGKSSIGYSTKDPLLLDFDGGAHRAANRRDTLQITTWADVTELMEHKAALEPYSTIVVDTVGRALDLLAADIIEQNPKYARDGALTLQGFGVLKTRFRLWITQLRALGKDVALIAHHREEKDGDVTVMRPDIIGASYGEVMKLADFVGFMYMRGKDRVLDFSPTDRWVGKNPAQWKPIAVPAVEKARDVMAGLFESGRAALGKISEQSAQAAQQVDDWRAQIQTFTTAEDFNRNSKAIEPLPEVVKAALRVLVRERAKALGVTFDKDKQIFVGGPTLKATATPAELTADAIGW